MAKKEKVAIKQQDANRLLLKFLSDNRIKLDITSTEGGVDFVGDGFVLTDKPLIKIVARYA